jgi:hypothetical protein
MRYQGIVALLVIQDSFVRGGRPRVETESAPISTPRRIEID